MDFRSISYFVEIAEQKSFTKASRKLLVSQPALSKCIANFESELGSALFVREHGSIRLTDAGRTAYRYCKDLLSHYNMTMEKLTSIHGDSKTNINIGISPFLNSLFQGRMLIVPDEDSSITANYFEDGQAQLIDSFIKKKLDIIVTLLFDYEDKDIKGDSHEVLYTGNIEYVVSRNCPDSIRNIHDFTDTVKLACSMDSANKIEEYSSVPVTKMYTNSISSILSLVENSGFVGVVPDIALPAVKDHVRRLDTVPIIKYNIVCISANDPVTDIYSDYIKKSVKEFLGQNADI